MLPFELIWTALTRSVPRIIALCGLTLSFGLVATSLAIESKTAPANLETLRARVADLKTRLNAELSQQPLQAAALERTEVKLGNTARSLFTLELEHRAITTERAKLGKQRQFLDRALRSEQAALGLLVRAAFAVERRSNLQIVLAQSSTQAAGRALSYARYLHAHTARQLEGLGASTRELAAVRAAVTMRSNRLDDLIQTTRETQTRLEQQRNERASVLAKLNLGIQSKREQLRRLRADHERLRRLLEGLGSSGEEPNQPRVKLPGLSQGQPRGKSRLLPGSVPAKGRGAESAPARSLQAEELVEREVFARRRGRLESPVVGRILHRFGTSRAGENLRWRGIWLHAPRGSEVRAVSAGQVAFADWLRGFGLLLIIDHGDGYMSLYGHNSTLLKETGDWVDSGQIIARVGDTGGLSRAGLYFEIREGGLPVNPLTWLVRKRTSNPRIANRSKRKSSAKWRRCL